MDKTKDFLTPNASKEFNQYIGEVAADLVAGALTRSVQDSKALLEIFELDKSWCIQNILKEIQDTSLYYKWLSEDESVDTNNGKHYIYNKTYEDELEEPICMNDNRYYLSRILEDARDFDSTHAFIKACIYQLEVSLSKAFVKYLKNKKYITLRQKRCLHCGKYVESQDIYYCEFHSKIREEEFQKNSPKATPKQIKYITGLAKQRRYTVSNLDDLTMYRAGVIIDYFVNSFSNSNIPEELKKI